MYWGIDNRGKITRRNIMGEIVWENKVGWSLLRFILNLP